jgi:hypothetical protein
MRQPTVGDPWYKRHVACLAGFFRSSGALRWDDSSYGVFQLKQTDSTTRSLGNLAIFIAATMSMTRRSVPHSAAGNFQGAHYRPMPVPQLMPDGSSMHEVAGFHVAPARSVCMLTPHQMFFFPLVSDSTNELTFRRYSKVAECCCYI